jgi:hypothetical protein
MLTSAIKNFSLGILGGLVAGAIVIAVAAPIREKVRGPLDRCMATYLVLWDHMSDELKHDPDLLKAIADAGAKDYKGLVESRCEAWIKNGQQY